jgi:hypothetical protein
MKLYVCNADMPAEIANCIEGNTNDLNKVYWNRVGGFILVLLGLMWEMASILDFGMICCLGKALIKAFPNLYGIARVHDSSVAALLEYYGHSLQWNVSFTRAAHN